MKFYYFNSTHWDREWYQPLQRYRRYLVQTTDGILKALENDPEFQKYTFDGQTIVLEDVVEIHPEWRERIKAQVASGRLNVGPWYVMPDEFLVSGESLIRNLLIGREVAESFGAPAWSVGYICDIFGHMAQMPQIFNGFHLAPAVIWRGVDSTCAPYFLWQAPDGSQCETVKLMSRNGYADFSLWVTGWWDRDLTEAEFKSRFLTEVERLKPYFGENMILSDALDHINVHSQAPQYLKWIKELYPESEVIHTDYREVLDEFKDRAACPVLAGELIQTIDRKPSDGWMIPHTLSGRYDIKQANDACQNRLELGADPVQAAAVFYGSTEMTPFWKYAWKQLIKNHPHDSICGCSIDAVHRQMLPRFEEIEQVADCVIENWLLADRAAQCGRTIQEDTKTTLIQDHSRSDVAENGEYTLSVYNPLPWAQEQVVHFEIAFPAAANYPEKMAEPFGYEFLHCFRLFDAEGAELAYSLGAVKLNQTRRFYRHDTRAYHIYPVTFKTKLAPASWSRIQVKPSADNVRYFVSQLESARSASNGLVSVAVNADGTFDLFDKRNGNAYRKLNDFVIDREIGDGWNHVRPAGAPILAGTFGNAQVAVLEDGPVRTVFSITRSCVIAKELEFRGTLNEGYAGIAESPEKVTLEIHSLVTLDAGSDSVQVKTTVLNQVKDYRLRLVMPTGIPGNYFAYQNFTFLDRAAGRGTGRATERHPEAEPLEKNFSGIAGKRNDDSGIALISRYGLHEVAAAPWRSGEMYFTLLRSFRRTVGTSGEEEGQMQKALTYEYSFTALTPATDNAVLYRKMLEFRGELPHYLLPAHDAGAPTHPWVELSGGLSLAALKPAQDGSAGTVVIRLMNLSAEPRSGELTFAKAAEVVETDLAEVPQQKSRKGVKTLTVTAAPWKLVTYRVKW